MLLLAVDSSGKNGSIALAQCEADGTCHPWDPVPLSGGAFSAQLVPQIAALLAEHHFSKTQLDGFAVVSGPGSFTGLRVGLAAIKALAEVLHKPIATISLLQAVASSSDVTGIVLSALDAGRGEFYMGEYEGDQYRRTMLSERLLTLPEFRERARGAVVITPDLPASEAAAGTAAKLITVPRPNAATIAPLGWQKIHAGQLTSPEDLEANYIRSANAQLPSHPG